MMVWKDFGRKKWIGFLGLAFFLVGCGVSTATSHSAVHLSVSSSTPIGVYATPRDTFAVAPSSENRFLWILAGKRGGRTVSLVDLHNRKITIVQSISRSVGAIATEGQVLGLGSPGGHNGWVEFWKGPMGGADTLFKTVRLAGAVRSLAVGDNGTFYALNGHSSEVVSVIDSRTGRVLATVDAPKTGVAVVATPHQSSVYVLESDGNVEEVGLPSGQVESLFPVGHSGRSMAISPSGDILYVLKGRGSTRNVAVVNLSIESVLRAIPAPAHANAISLSVNGKILYDAVGTATFGNIQAYRVG